MARFAAYGSVSKINSLEEETAVGASDMVSVLNGTTDDGFVWILRAGFDASDDLMTMLEVRRGDHRGEGGFGGPPLYVGQRLNTWIGSRWAADVLGAARRQRCRCRRHC